MSTLKFEEILTQFKSEKPKKKVWGNYRIEGDRLVYKTRTTVRKRFRNIADFNAYVKDKGTDRFFRHTREGGEISLSGAQGKFTDPNSWETIYCQQVETNVIAIRVTNAEGATTLLGNSSTLDLIGRQVNYGRDYRNRHQTKIQEIIAADSDFITIPFNVFEEAKLSLYHFDMVEKGKEETVTVKETAGWNYQKGKEKTINVKRHFTGASLFKVQDQHYLFDIDRREIKHKIFNAFLATVPGTPKTIKEAYALLKPKAVIDAEKKRLKVLRQGEWFFIPTQAPKFRKFTEREKLIMLVDQNPGRFRADLGKALGVNLKKITKEAEKLEKEVPTQQVLAAGDSRPNTVQLCFVRDGKTYCKGKVSHTGREHADLVLKDWHLAVPNTSIKNFTVTGDVD